MCGNDLQVRETFLCATQDQVGKHAGGVEHEFQQRLIQAKRDLQGRADSSQADQQKRPNTEQERLSANFFPGKYSGDLTKPGEHAQTSVDSGLGRSAGDASQGEDDRICMGDGLDERGACVRIHVATCSQ